MAEGDKAADVLISHCSIDDFPESTVKQSPLPPPLFRRLLRRLIAFLWYTISILTPAKGLCPK